MKATLRTQEDRYVVFRLLGEDYALSIAGVHTVEKIMPITRVPNAPPFVDGVVNLRGDVVPVINLRRRLGLPPADADVDAHIVVALEDDQLVGLIVDEISHVMSLPQTAIQAAGQVVGETNRSFLQGIAKNEDKLIVILDLERVVDPEL